MKKALITGINGQDGSYLAQLLLANGYQVHGVVRQSSMENHQKLSFLKDISHQLTLHICSLTNHLSIYKLIDTMLVVILIGHLLNAQILCFPKENDY